MKEITAIIRMNMVTKTKEALLKSGFPAFSCRKVMGRGKRKVDFSFFTAEFQEKLQDKNIAEQVTEMHRLVSKRMITILVDDADVQNVVSTIIEANHTGNPGDGKIFITNVVDVARVRTGEKGTAAI
ncbi:P-II family nitrogen regulator [Clostridiaceae bacterium UIB06]|nr:P-II family nitrogen regulator [Clostridiaceae bacterium UIB06]